MDDQTPVDVTPDIPAEPVGGIEAPPEEPLFYEVDNQKIPTTIEEVTKFINSRDPELAQMIKGDKKLTKLAVDLMGKDRRAEKKFHSAGLANRQAEEIAKLIQNPMSLLKHPDPAVRQLYHDATIEYLQELAAQEEMTPEQRRAAELEEENKQYKEYIKQQQMTEQQKQAQRQREMYVDQLLPQMDKAITENNIDTPYETAVAQIAWYMDRSIDAAKEYDDSSLILSPAEAAKLYKQDLDKMTKPQVPVNDVEKLMAMLGPEGKETVRKALLAEANGKPAGVTQTITGQSPKPQPKGNKKPLSTDEFRAMQEERLNKIFGQK